jgi:hypothetical protein
MIVSMIRGEIFRVSWLLKTLDRHPFKIFSMHIMRFKTEQPTESSIKIWLIIFGFTRETTLFDFIHNLFYRVVNYF